MADVTERLIIRGEDQTRAAVESAKRGSSSLQKSYSSLASSVVAVAGAYVSWRAAQAVIGRSIELAGVQELAERKLSSALGHTSTALLQQASALQQVTTYGDEAIITQQAFLASLAFSEDQIRQIIPVALDLAAATGLSLESAVRNTAKTFSGLTGELGELVPQLRELTAEELKSGDAVRVLAELFGGQAAAQADTFSGRIAQLSNAYGDMLEQVGDAFIKNEQFNDTIVRLTQSMQDMQPVINLVTEAITKAGGVLADYFHLLSTEGQRDAELATLMEDQQELQKHLNQTQKYLEEQRAILAGNGPWYSRLQLDSATEANIEQAERTLGNLTEKLRQVKVEIEGNLAAGQRTPGAATTTAAAPTPSRPLTALDKAKFTEAETFAGDYYKFQAQIRAQNEDEENATLQRISDAYFASVEYRMMLDRAAANEEIQMRQNRLNGVYGEHQNELAAIDQFYQEKLTRLANAGASQQELEEVLSMQSRERAQAEADFKVQVASQTAGNLANIAYSFYQLSNKQSKTAFKAYQALAVSQTIIDTYKAAQGAYASLAGIPIVGPVLGAAAAAAAVVAGLARVKAIQSQSLGGGAAVAPQGAGANFSGATPTAPAQGINAPANQQTTQNITVVVHNPLGTENWDRLAQDEIVPAIKRVQDRDAA